MSSDTNNLLGLPMHKDALGKMGLKEIFCGRPNIYPYLCNDERSCCAIPQCSCHPNRNRSVVSTWQCAACMLGLHTAIRIHFRFMNQWHVGVLFLHGRLLNGPNNATYPTNIDRISSANPALDTNVKFIANITMIEDAATAATD